MFIGTLSVQNDAKTKTYAIYQGPKHKNYKISVGPQSLAGFPVNDRYGNTYFRAIPVGGGANKDLVISSTNKRKIIWVLPDNTHTPF
jgi:hypothetical protein